MHTSASKKYADGEVDKSVFMEDVQLTHKRTERLIDRLTALPWPCGPSSEPSYKQISNTPRPKNLKNRDRYRRDPTDLRDHLDYRRQNPHQSNWRKQTANHHLYRRHYGKCKRGCYNCGENNHNSERCRFDRPIQMMWTFMLQYVYVSTTIPCIRFLAKMRVPLHTNPVLYGTPKGPQVALLL
ncbi:hypothetical protein BSL78_10815 [Apostichopus japonicus]|uniref:CCHC-type domain-containing protein n=1 Tax=Stichopus japonicus TaxID=307972 RepID=A0A2G8KW65_STIJA|nr:hypothetical protein BSL78_10815 [Apostichopus japonicus]